MTEDAEHTHITVTHLGWKEGPEWDREFEHFTRGWSDLAERFKFSIDSGPIDWATEFEPKSQQDKDHFTLVADFGAHLSLHHRAATSLTDSSSASRSLLF